MKKHFVIIVIVCFINCIFSKGQSKNLITVDIEKAFNNVKEIMLSDFVESIEYIVLETEGHPIETQLKVYSNAKQLACIAFRQMYLFDRQTGKFIMEIGKYGRGPEEYRTSKYFDSDIQCFIAQGFDKDMDIVEYNLNGKMTRRIPVPQKEIVIRKEGDPWGDQLYIIGSIFLDKHTVVFYNNNVGDVKERLLITDENGKVFRTFYNSNRFIRQNMKLIHEFPPIFYRHGENTMFYENCIDTIYRVNKNSMISHFQLKMGKYKPPYEKRGGELNDLDSYFKFSCIGENDNFLFFDFSYKRNRRDLFPTSFFGYYNKKTELVKIADADHNGRRIINNIDNFSAIQLSKWTINDRDNEMVSYIEAKDIVEWFKKNPKEAKQLPVHLQKLSKVKENDNPIVVIAKLK